MQTAKDRGKGDVYYARRAENYERRRLGQDWWHVEQREMRELLDGLPRNMRVVDIPFGTGRFVPFYDEFGYDIAGLDSSKDMLKAAWRSLGPLYDKCTCVTGDAAKLPYADGQFDLIVSTRFLRDIIVYSKAREILAEMSRVTGKYAIIQLGDRIEGHRTPDEDEVMSSHLSPKQLDTLLADNGLDVIERRQVKEMDDGGLIHHILCKKT